jgi:hypothetical protein
MITRTPLTGEIRDCGHDLIVSQAYFDRRWHSNTIGGWLPRSR